MNSKITLRFNTEVINSIKVFAASNNISVSKLTEYLFENIATKKYKTLDDLPISKWVSALVEPDITYQKQTKKPTIKYAEYYEAKTKKK